MAKKKEIITPDLPLGTVDPTLVDVVYPDQKITTIVEYSKTEVALATLRQKYQGATYEVGTKAGMELARKSRAEIKVYRVDLEKERVRIKAPALEHCRLIDAEAKRITAELESLEKPIDDQIQAEEQRVERERAEKIRLENERRQGIQTKIMRFRSVAAAMVNKSSAEVEEVLGKVQSALVGAETYAEWTQEAVTARDNAVVALESLLLDIKGKEEERKRIVAERVELEQLREKDRIRREKEEKEQRAAEATLTAEHEANRLREEQAERERQRKIEEQRQSEEKVRLAQEAEQRRLDEEKAVLAEEKRRNDAINARLAEENRLIKMQQEEANRLAADRIKALSKARRATPEKALADILGICQTGIKGTDPFLRLAEIELIAEASLPKEKSAPKTRLALKSTRTTP